MGRVKKILIHSIAFSPDGVSTAYLYNDIALKFKQEGFDVTVLTTTPQFNLVESELKKQPLEKKMFGLYFKSTYHNIPVIHIPQKKYKSSVLRIFGFAYWHILAFFIGIFLKKIDVIISPSPPLTICLVNIFIGKIKRAKIIYNVQEIYPDILIKENGLKENSLITNFLRKIERFVYNYSDAVTTIDEVFTNKIKDRFIDISKLKTIPNFVDINIYRPITNNNLTISKKYFPDNDSLKLMYAGNIGFAQDWKLLIDLAIKLNDKNIEFFIIGEGAMIGFLTQKIEEHCLTKVHLIPYQQRELMPQLIAYSDIQFIFMTPQSDEDGFPSKVYTIMACEKPLLVSSGINTSIVNFLKDKNCSFIVSETDYDMKLSILEKILADNNRAELSLMGKNGIKYIHNHYSKDIVTQQYVDLVDFIAT